MESKGGRRVPCPAAGPLGDAICGGRTLTPAGEGVSERSGGRLSEACLEGWEHSLQGRSLC